MRYQFRQARFGEQVIVGVVALIATLLADAPQVHAFVRQTVKSDPTIPLYWPDRTIVIHAAPGTCADADPALARAALWDSLGTWNNAGGGCSDILLQWGSAPQGEHSTDTNLVSPDPDFENRIVWRPEADWPTCNEDSDEDCVSDGVVALTTSYYDPHTGTISDADIDLNDKWYWTVGDTGVSYDVQNAVTHELGHLLGLAHSPDPNATMYASADEGELKKRDLGLDDINGLCTIYPAGLPTPGNLQIIRGALESGSSCSVVRKRDSSPWDVAPLLGAFGLLSWRRSSRARKRATHS